MLPAVGKGEISVSSQSQEFCLLQPPSWAKAASLSIVLDQSIFELLNLLVKQGNNVLEQDTIGYICKVRGSTNVLQRNNTCYRTVQ